VPSPFSIGFYDPKKKIILESGNSRPCGCNHNKISIHAEQKAISYCRSHDKKHNYKIYIARYAKDGHLKPAYCCHACSQLATKYEFQDRIYTLKDGSFISALKENPEISLGYKIKHEY
jgi:cytidine deaminase